MKEINLVQDDRHESEQRADAPAPASEIRVLEGYELVLAAGGEGILTWP